MGDSQPFVTISEWQPTDGHSFSSGDSAVRRNNRTARPQARSRLITSSQYGSSIEEEKGTPSATHDISRVSYHVKHLPDFAKTLEDVRSSLSFLSVRILHHRTNKTISVVGYASFPQPGRLTKI